ncbi:MAG: phosphotransferase family protein [Candidatus Odinarchaeota archaeon]
MAFFEENRAADISLAEIYDALHVFFSDIKENDIKYFYHGTYNVYEVKNQYIFRIPDKSFRNIKGVKLIQNELKMLYHIQKYISVSIPEPTYVSLDPDCPLMGYKKIDGIPLSKCFYKTSREEKFRIARRIGEFLSELHSGDLYKVALRNQIIDDTFSCEKYKIEWKNYLEKAQKNIFQLLNSNQKKWITNLFDTFLKNQANFNFRYSIVHGDFDISNIIVNPHTFDITGVVDFEQSRIYDPAVDFLFYDEGDTFLNNIFLSYKRETDPEFKERMKFLYGWSCLAYIDFGMKNDLPDLIEAGFELLKNKMNRFPV